MLAALAPLILLWVIYFAINVALFNDRQRRGKTVKKAGPSIDHTQAREWGL